MIGKKRLLRRLAQKLTKTDSCGVKGCSHTESIELVELKPFDPIDHDEKYVAVCPDHQIWADKRNEFAEDMADKLREARKEIGQEHIGRIQELAMPQGNAREDVLMGEVEQDVALEDAFEGDSLLDEPKKSDLLTGGNE